MTASSPHLLEVKNLAVNIETRSGGLVRAARGLDFAVNHSRTLGVVGESGCGKSITALAIMRLLPRGAEVTAGEIIFEGEDLLKKDDRQMRALRGRRIGMILQDPMVSLDPLFTIGDQIEEALGVHGGMSRRERRKRAIELLTLVGIPSPETRLKQYPHEMSGGMLQRVIAAIAICWNPPLLIADEPTTALDPTIQVQVLDLLAGLRDEHGISIIMVTHDFGVAARICDDIMVMYAGQIVEKGPVHLIFQAPRHPYTRALIASSGASGGQGRLTTIEGQPPDLSDLPPGCAFAPRCALAQDRCREQAPPRVQLDGEHHTYCWRVEEAQ
jgi:oligopeptide/dipeptide ABC transporter ATP-binding protein